MIDRANVDIKLMPKVKYLFLSSLILAVFNAGCVSIPQQQKLKFNALIFNNATGLMLKNVSVKVKNTRAYAMCSVLHQGRSCSTSFQTKAYQGNPVYISWEQKGRVHELGPLFAKIPDFIDSNKNATVMIKFESITDTSVELKY